MSPPLPSSSPSAEGIGQDTLEAGIRLARDRMPSLRCLVVLRHGRLVAEEYFGGAGPDTPFNVKSVTKSILSALVGIAIDQGSLSGVRQPIAPVLAGRPDGGAASPDRDRAPLRDRRPELTVEHLLTMTTGQQWSEGQQIRLFFDRTDPVRFALALPFASRPGARFTYSTPASHLLSAVITVITSMDTRQFAQRFLFDALGAEITAWPTDRQGIPYGGSELFLTARALAGFGLLYVQDGRFGSRQVLPSTWVHASLARHTEAHEPLIPDLDGYGYLWWRRRVHGLPIGCALGIGGQFLFVVPDRQLVIVATSTPDGDRAASQERFASMFHTLDTYLIPSLVEG